MAVNRSHKRGGNESRRARCPSEQPVHYLKAVSVLKPGILTSQYQSSVGFLVPAFSLCIY